MRVLLFCGSTASTLRICPLNLDVARARMMRIRCTPRVNVVLTPARLDPRSTQLDFNAHGRVHASSLVLPKRTQRLPKTAIVSVRFEPVPNRTRQPRWHMALAPCLHIQRPTSYTARGFRYTPLAILRTIPLRNLPICLLSFHSPHALSLCILFEERLPGLSELQYLHVRLERL